MKSDSIVNLVKGILSKDRRSLSKAITLVESTLKDDQKVASELFHELHRSNPNAESLRVGLTGSPGVGKSTFIESFGTHLSGNNLHIAILAIDPSSPRSGGSILGDKTRMPTLTVNPKAFIRPSPSRGDLGGVVASSYDTIRLCEYAGFDVILVESVGVGQSELSLSDLVDIYTLLVAPGAGDELQGIKKGITELADLILVNKCDPPLSTDAKMTLYEYKSAMKFRPLSPDTGKPDQIPVLPVSARTGHGIADAWSTIRNLAQNLKDQGWASERRKRQAQTWAKVSALHQLTQRLNNYYKDKHYKLDPSETMALAGSRLMTDFLRDEK